MVEDPAFVVQIAAGATLALLAVAALHDLGFRTVPNALALGLLGCGVLRHAAAADFPAALAAAGTVFAGAVALWHFGMLGGGDAKLIAAASFAVPPGAVVPLLLATSLAGGVLAVAFLALRPLAPAAASPRPVGLLRRVARVEAWRIRRRGPLPYAVAIAAGGLAVLVRG